MGTVIDSATGAPVAGVTLTFSPATHMAFTDKRGAFAVMLEEGSGAVTIERLGYRTTDLAITVDSGMAPLTIRLAPDPVMLEGIAVIESRLNTNPLAIAMAVHTFGEADLARARNMSVGAFLGSRGAITPAPCPLGTWAKVCLWSRGQVIEPRVWIDDYRPIAGLDELSMFSLQKVYRVDVYQQGVYIHVLTKSYIDETIRRGRTVFAPF